MAQLDHHYEPRGKGVGSIIGRDEEDPKPRETIFLCRFGPTAASGVFRVDFSSADGRHMVREAVGEDGRS